MSAANAMTLPSNPDAILIDASNLPSGIIYKNRNALRNVNLWHKFIVANTEGLSRDEVLKTILDHVHPMDLIPVYFAKDPRNSNSYFLARNCEAAVDKLCKDNLVVDHPYSKTGKSKNWSPFKITILLNFSNTIDVRIDVQKNVLAVLNKRFSTVSKTLNLDKFAEDPELVEFCPLSQPKIMYFVLHISKSLSPEEIILSNNHIRLLNPLDVLIGLKIRVLDLRNNEIMSLDDVSTLKHFQLKSLFLDGNGLCNCEEDDYVYKVRSLCPTVEILDGVPLTVDKFLVTKRYFFCDDTGVDLVNQFLEYFFTIFDTRDRKSLAGLYHPEAMFSLTCVYLATQLSSASAVLKTYSSISRNLKRAADLSKTEACLFRGRDNIINLFESTLLPTEHDPYSLNAELIYKTEKCAVIVVSGVFHELPNTLLENERLVGFTRTFALATVDDSKYVITNEQLHVYNGLTYQEKNSFLEPITQNKLIQKEFLPKPQTPKDFKDLISTLGEISSLKDEWARKCLEECQYDLKRALELFVDLYKGDKIPRNAFVDINSENSKTTKSCYGSPKASPYKAIDNNLKVRKPDLNNNPPVNVKPIEFLQVSEGDPNGDLSNNAKNYLLPTPKVPLIAQHGNYQMSIIEPSKINDNHKPVITNSQQKKTRGPSVYTVLR